MNNAFPVYTMPNECQDCYKCIRHCACKAIQVVNGSATVIPELCISCGECVKICPAHAKRIRSDLSRAKFLLTLKEKVYASIAPSYMGYFKNVTIGQISTAVKMLGFNGCSETALGAQIVSSATAKFLKDAPSGVYISSACPAAVDYISKYKNNWVKAIAPTVSPVIAHTRMLRENFGSDINVVFIGPCAAKKNESDNAPDELTLVLTFEAFERWLDENNIDISTLEESELVPYAAEEGRSYSLEGGMNDTLRGEEADPSVRYIASSGIENIAGLLDDDGILDAENINGKLFIEALACNGGCINGPVMGNRSASANTLLSALASIPNKSSASRPLTVATDKGYYRKNIERNEITEQQITEALFSIGKHSKEDELNCGGCGYNTCREFAMAKIEQKAETAMCLSYLRKISERTSDVLIKSIPVGVVIVDRNLQIVDCNEYFARLCGEENLNLFKKQGNLVGEFLVSMVEFTDLFDSVLEHGGELIRLNQSYGGRILNIKIFSISHSQTVGAVIEDVTQNEIKREQVAEKAREVIRKNVLTVQKIARELGEHMAETEIILDEVAGSYSVSNDKDL